MQIALSRLRILVTAAAAGLAVSCASGARYAKTTGDGSQPNAPAAPSPATALDPAPPENPPAGAFPIDPVHSSAVFRIKHLGTDFYGRFDQMDGYVLFDPRNPGGGEIFVTIPTASVDTDKEARDEHLRSPDYFAADEYDEMRFVSSEITPLSGDRYRVDGDLTIRGVTRPLSTEFTYGGESFDPFMETMKKSGSAEFTISRSAFGVDGTPSLLSDEVDVLLGIEAKAPEGASEG
ncbi:MAG: YceI family protein [Sumerlaeia bacterium]